MQYRRPGLRPTSKLRHSNYGCSIFIPLLNPKLTYLTTMASVSWVGAVFTLIFHLQCVVRGILLKGIFVVDRVTFSLSHSCPVLSSHE